MSRVLVVHASVAVGSGLAATLRSAGYITAAVTSGERAMDRFVQEPADVVVIDYALGGRDGVSTAEAIRWMPGGQRARLILTADPEIGIGSLDELARGVEPFATAVGPLDPDSVLALVQRAAEPPRREGVTRVLKASEELAVPDEIDPAWDTKTAPESDLSADEAAPLPEAPSADGSVEEALEFDEQSDAEEVARVRALVRASRAAGPTNMGGTFDVDSFAHVLGRLDAESATGGLVCVQEGETDGTLDGGEIAKVAHVRGGRLVFVQSNREDDSFARALSTRLVDPSNRGATSAIERARIVDEVLRERAYELFTWRRGSYRFVPQAALPDGAPEIDGSLGSLVWEGVRRSPAELAISDLASDLDHYVVPRPRGMLRALGLPLPRDLHAIVRRIDGRTRLHELVDGLDDMASAAHLVATLACVGAITFAQEPEERTSATPSPRWAASRENRTTSAREASGLRVRSDTDEPGTSSESEVLDERIERLLSAERLFRRAQRALDRSRPEEAEEALQRALTLCPDEGRYAVFLAWARHAGKPSEGAVLAASIDLAERACALAPDLAVGHVLRARLLGAAGRRDDARVAFARALELDPGNEEAARGA